MAPRLDHLPKPVARVLATYYRVRRRHALLRILCLAALLYLALALLAMHLDRLLFLTRPAREILFWAVHLLVGAYAAAAVVGFLLRPPSIRRIAYDLENLLPDGSSERYVTLDSILQEPDAGENEVRRQLVDQLRRSTEEISAGVRPGRLVRDPWLRRLALGLLAAVLAYVGLLCLPAYQFPLMARRFLRPGANLAKPSFVRIRVSPESLVLGRGDEAVLQAEIEGEIPSVLAWLYRLAGATPQRCLIATAPGQVADLPIDPSTARDLSRIQRRLFVYSRSELEESFSYRLRCGDAETEVRFVEVVAQPQITELRLVVIPPGYTRRPTEEIVDPRQPVRLFPGTKVELVFTVDQTVPERRLLLGSREGPAPQWDAATRTGRYAFTMEDPVDIEVRVANARGFPNVDRARVSLVRLNDQPPVVQLEYPAGDLAVVPGELIPVQALGEDDLEVVEAAVRFQMNPEINPDAPFQELPIPILEPSGTRVALTENFDLGETSAGPGDEILFLVRVRDSGGNDGESRPVRIRVNAFTRGENERRRLSAARVLAGILRRLGDSLPATVDPALDPSIYEPGLKEALARGVSLEETPSLTSLFHLLEMEHHFTDAPRHKQDLREFHAVLFAAWASGAPAPTAFPSPRALVDEVLDPVIRSRQLQNVTWRLFGMQGEIADLRQRLTGIEAEEARLAAGARDSLVSLLASTAEAAAAHREVLALQEKELKLRRSISDIKARAAKAAEPEGEVVENPFAPLQLDVEATQLTAEDQKKVEDLKATLDAAVAERTTLSAAAVQRELKKWQQANRDQPPPLEPAALETLVATMFDRVARPPPDLGPLATPAARRALAEELAMERLRARPGGESPPRRSLSRRADLYLKALENIGVDLAAVAEGSPHLNAERLKSLQGELNTAGYYLNRGSLARNIASCDEVAERLGRLIGEIRPALPALLRDEQRARGRLHELYRAAGNWAVAGLAGGAGNASPADRALEWIDADLRMIERNPFAPLSPRLRNLGLIAARERGVSPANQDGESLFQPADELAGATAVEEQINRQLALEWEISDLLRSTRVSPAEQKLAAALLELGSVLADPARPAPEVAGRERKILDLPLGSDASAPARDRSLRPQRVNSQSLTQAEGVLLRAMQERLPLGKPLEVAAATLDRTARAVRAVEELEAALNRGDTSLVETIRRTGIALAEAIRAYDRLVRLAALDVGYLDPLAPAAVQEEMLFLRVREAVGRYRGRVATAVRTLEESCHGELDAAQLGNLSGDVPILKAGVQALHHSLQKAIEDYATAEAQPRYPILETFAETRAWIEIARELEAASAPAEVAGRFVQSFAVARVEFLAGRSRRLESASEDLREFVAQLEAGAIDPAALRRRLESARVALADFQSAVETSGEGPMLNRFRADLTSLLARLDRLARQSADSETDRRRQLLDLAELQKDTAGLLRRSRAEIDQASGLRLEYAGGPDGIWLQTTRLDAEVSRQRLLGQIRQARRSFTLEVLAALEPDPDAERSREAMAWGLFCHRVARSPLSGAVTPPRIEAGGDSTRNPLVKWLLEQLEEAARESRGEDRLRNYPDITRELIQSLQDFMRY